ncbi:homoserine kinase [Nocardioides marmoraquaticus]
MTDWSRGPVTVEVPATSANLGPGYDCLGLALERVDTLVGEVVDEGLVVEVEGEGAADVARDEGHLVVRAMRAWWSAYGATPPGLRLRCTNRLPHSRGMGSSSAAIVGGLVLARSLAGVAEGEGPDLLPLANALEGHPDNVAPALLGGLVVSGQQGGAVWAQRVPLAPGVRGVVLVPPQGVATEVARGLLPDTVPHAEAAANTGRAALLVAALAHDPSPATLLRATEDFLHQQYRRPAMPDSLDLVERLRADGVPATVSGAGPTVLAWVVGPDADGIEQQVLDAAPQGWEASVQDLGGPGARVLA